MKVRVRSLSLLACVLLASGVASQAADAPSLAALQSLERGQWQLREAGTGGTTRGICVSNAEALLQLRHPASRCSRYVIDNQPRRSTVHYTCPGSGYGRTTIDQITPRSIHIETQGIAMGAPFHVEIEGRRTGDCAAS